MKTQGSVLIEHLIIVHPILDGPAELARVVGGVVVVWQDEVLELVGQASTLTGPRGRRVAATSPARQGSP